MFCKHFKDPKPNKTDRFVRALYFPPDEVQGKAAPQLSWVKVERHEHDENDSEAGIDEFDQFDRTQHFGGKSLERGLAYRNRLQARDIGRSKNENLIIWQLDLTVRYAINEAVLAISRNRCTNERWRGPLLLFRQEDLGEGSSIYHDIDQREIRHAADFFTSTFMIKTLPTEIWIHYLALTVDYPKELGGATPTFNPRVIDQGDLVWNREGSGIANLVGLPLLIRYDPSEDPAKNEVALLLKTDITCKTTAPKTSRARSDGEDEAFQAMPMIDNPGIYEEGAHSSKAGRLGFGATVQPPADDKKGRILIARADGEPLLGRQLEALLAYIDQIVKPMLASATAGLGPGEVVKDREECLKKINKASFSKFYKEYKQLRSERAKTAQEKKEWEGLHSMYDMYWTHWRWSNEIGELYDMQDNQAHERRMGRDMVITPPNFYMLSLPPKDKK